MIVWLASYPRSGNTFFRVILNSIFDLKTYSVYDDRYDIGADKETSDIVGHVFLPDDSSIEEGQENAKAGWSMPAATIEKMRDDDELYIVKTHELLDEYIQPEDKVIYLLRDGRESTLSFWKYRTDFTASKRTLNDFIQTGDWAIHVASWNPLSRDNTLLIKFEELIDKPEKMIGEISNFLNVKPVGGEIPTFEQLKKVNPKFFRSGKINSWKNIFSEDDHKQFWQKNAQEMIKYGYTDTLPAGYMIEDRMLIPKITIVTVSFNAVEDIERTIQSVTNQNYSNIEYIIIDGSSTDGTVNILKKYDDKITYWVSEPDGGIYNAMNKAIDIANGEWVNFMNAGDTFVDEKVISNFVKKASLNSDICYGTRYLHKQNEIVFQETEELKDFYYRMPFGHQAAFVKKGLLKKYKFDLSYKLSADYDFFIRCYRENYVFQNLNFPVCNFYANGLSAKFGFKSLVETLKVLSDYVDANTVKKSVFYNNLKRSILAEASKQSKNEALNLLDQNYRLQKELCFQAKKSETIEKKLNSIISGIDRLATTKFSKSPIQKYQVYKQMLTTYYTSTKHPLTPEKIFLLPADMPHIDPDKQFCISENEHPVLIYQVGKVGSSAIYMGIKEQIKTLPVYQVHNINQAQALLNKNIKEDTQGNVAHFIRGIGLKETIAEEPNIQWQIITGVREPISRWISDVFENIHTRYKFLKNNDNDINIEKTIQYIKDTINEEPQEKWFNDELLTTFGVNVFDTPFNGNSQIIHYNKIDILIYKFENMQKHLPSTIKEFLNLKDFDLATANETSQKSTADAYKEVKQQLAFEVSFLDKFYKKRVIGHFYSDEEIKGFKEQWKK